MMQPMKTAESAARHVAAHPVLLCQDFTPQPEPAAFWCATCRWNKVLHADDMARKAIGEALALRAGSVSRSAGS